MVHGSQFVFELENVAQMHSNSEIDRKMQRRLAMISGLQAETIKLEKSARAERLNIVKRASIIIRFKIFKSKFTAILHGCECPCWMRH